MGSQPATTTKPGDLGRSGSGEGLRSAGLGCRSYQHQADSHQADSHQADPHQALPTEPSELRAGLLVFFARPSLLQTWAELCGHEWRHIGITVDTSEGLRIASYCIRKCFRVDDPNEIILAYNRVGVAEIFASEHEQREFERFCRKFEFLERSDSPYTASGILVGPLHLMARHCPPGPLRDVLFRVIYRYCTFQQRRYRDRSAFCCSTFAWAAIKAARRRPLRIPLSAHPKDEASYLTKATPIDDLFARWLCGPTEIWQAIDPTDRAELHLANSANVEGPQGVEILDAVCRQVRSTTQSRRQRIRYKATARAAA